MRACFPLWWLAAETGSQLPYEPQLDDTTAHSHQRVDPLFPFRLLCLELHTVSVLTTVLCSAISAVSLTGLETPKRHTQ